VDEEAKQSYISDDNQKVVFHGADGNIYSINSDGSQKLVIVSKAWEDSLKAGTSIFIDGFVPDSRQLFFRADLCESQEWRSPCSTSLFLANADTGNIKRLADLGIASQVSPPTKNIKISPNGKMIAIGGMEHMDILDMEGNIIRQNILTYKPSTPSRSLFPSLFWLPDSSELTIALPDSKDRDGFLAYSLWRYTIGNQSAVQISLDPAPMYDDFTFDVSPDGNWIVYGNTYVVFLGNLVNEQVKIIEEAQQSSFSWGPDSRHFAFGTNLWYISTIDNPSVVIRTPSLKDWVDSTHYLNYYIENNKAKIAMAEISGDAIKIYGTEGGEDSEDFFFIKPK
jgi:dipeptidyl aminopeptidase/acylaminoacyl peptidase